MRTRFSVNLRTSRIVLRSAFRTSFKNKNFPTYNKQPSIPKYSLIWILTTDTDSLSNEKWHMVIDARKLNEANTSNTFSFLNYNNILEQSSNAQYILTFNLAPCFYHKNDQIVDQANISLHADTLEEHVNKFCELAKELTNAGLMLDIDKCEFLIKNESYKTEITETKNSKINLPVNNTKLKGNLNLKISRNLTIKNKEIAHLDSSVDDETYDSPPSEGEDELTRLTTKKRPKETSSDNTTTKGLRKRPRTPKPPQIGPPRPPAGPARQQIGSPRLLTGPTRPKKATGSSEPSVDDQATTSHDQETTQRSSPCELVQIGDATGKQNIQWAIINGSPSEHTEEVIDTDKKAPVESNFRSPSTKLGQNNNCDGIATLGNTLENIEPNFRPPSTPHGQQKPACKYARPSVQPKFISPPDPSVAYISRSYQKTVSNFTHSGCLTLTKHRKNEQSLRQIRIFKKKKKKKKKYVKISLAIRTSPSSTAISYANFELQL